MDKSTQTKSDDSGKPYQRWDTLHELIRSRGVTIYEFAERMGVSKSLVYQWIRSDVLMSVSHARKAAEVLECGNNGSERELALILLATAPATPRPQKSKRESPLRTNAAKENLHYF